jgi:predicted O-methyltransferase YrrM
MSQSLENIDVIRQIKAAYAPDDGAAREHNADASGLGFGLIHYTLIRIMKPQRVLAVGSRYGFIPACIALALKVNGKGRLDFVDASYDDDRDGFGMAYGGVGYWTKLREEVFRRFDLYEWIDIHVMKTDEFFSLCEMEYQYVYLDGDHSYLGVKFDAEQSVARLSRGGIMTFHDVLVDSQNFGVRAYLKEKYHPVILGEYPGLAIVQP